MIKIRLVLALAVFLNVYYTFGQTKNKSLNQKYGNNKSSLKFKMNKRMAVICPIFHPSEYPYQGIGFKAGDPFALTYKLFISKFLSISVDGGIGAYGLYKDRYEQLYENSEGADVLVYLSHEVEKDLLFSGKISYYHDGPNFLRGLDIYAGFGWQLRYTSILYGYTNKITPIISAFGTVTKQFDYMGPELHFGFEYAYFDLPISAFLEGNIFYDIVNQPTFTKFQGGIGVRYIF